MSWVITVAPGKSMANIGRTSVFILLFLFTSVFCMEFNHLDAHTEVLANEALGKRYSAFGGRIEAVLNRLDATPRDGDTNVTAGCLADILTWTEGLSNFTEWAGRMSDAWGAPQSGYLEGDSVWEGSWPECSRVNDVTTGIRGRHCLTGWYGVMLFDGFGTCLPSSCSEEDVKAFLIAGTDDLADIMPPLWPELGLEAETHCVIPADEKGITKDASAMAAIAVLSLFVLMAIIGTIYDLATMDMRKPPKTEEPPKKEKIEESPESEDPGQKTAETVPEPKVPEFRIPRPSLNGSLPRNGGHPPTYSTHVDNPVFDYRSESLLPTSVPNGLEPYPPVNYTNNNGAGHFEKGDTKQAVVLPEVQRKQWQPDTCGKFLLAFSVRQHVPRLLSFDHAKGSIQCLNGVRFLAFAWIVVGHTWSLGITISSAPTVANKVNILAADERPTQMALRNMPYSVESFFILSGLLTTISFMKKLQRKKPDCEMMGLYFFHRYWRLTPVYMLVLMAYACLFQYVASGPFYVGPEDNRDYGSCKETWWKNLLYLNNLIAGNEQHNCMGWTWYLANDFQFYVISPVFLFPLFYIPILGIVLTSLAIGGGLIANIYLDHKLFTQTNPDGSPVLDYFFDIYVPPWTRCTTYFSGVLLGYVLWKFNFKIKMNKGGVAVAWILMIVLSTVLVYVQFSEACPGCEPWPTAGTIIYDSLRKTAYGLVICWVIFACATGHGGFINSILSWNGWLPLARLSYAGYLFHPILMYFYFYQRPVQYYHNDMDQAFLSVGFLFMSLGGAFVISLLLEVPFMALEKLMFANTPGNRKKPEDKKPQVYSMTSANQAPATNSAPHLP